MGRIDFATLADVTAFAAWVGTQVSSHAKHHCCTVLHHANVGTQYVAVT